MQQDLWGDEIEIPTNHKTPAPRKIQGRNKRRRFVITTVGNLSNCALYGHAWEYFGITGLKQCSVCAVKGFCPVCTIVPPLSSAKPFYCTKHTPQEESGAK